MNTNILIVLVHALLLYPNTPIYAKGAILTDAWFILIYMFAVNPIMNVYSPWLFMRLLSKSSIRSKVKAGNANNITQAEAHVAHELPVWDPAFAHAGMIKDVLTCIFFQPLFPLASVVGVLTTFLMYWSQKHRFLNWSVRPFAVGHSIAYLSVYLLSLGPLVWGVGALLTVD